jgi:hypothetical protein
MVAEIDGYSLTTVPVSSFFNDTFLSSATAFNWVHEGQDFLITNWHVVTGRNNETGNNLQAQGGRPNRLALWFNAAGMRFGKSEATLELFSPDGNPIWLVHPVHGRKVDVVAIPIPAAPDGSAYWPINSFDETPLEVSVGQDVFILGYPFGFEQPGFPVWKRGSIASEPQVAPLATRYLLVDSASRPGMSGSPVIRRSWGQSLHGRWSRDDGPRQCDTLPWRLFGPVTHQRFE